VVAESALLRHQLLILNRGRKRAANLRATDRIAAGLLTLFVSPARILRSAVVLKPSTLLHLHQELIDAVVAMKRRNPSWGCPRIASSMIYQFALVTCKSGDWRL
jgi:putative transposase